MTRLYVDQSSEPLLTALYDDFRDDQEVFPDIVRESKRLLLGAILGAELNRLTELLLAVVRGHRRHRDYTRGQLRSALRELIACFPVYRTYVRAEVGQVADDDSRYVAEAVQAASARQPELPRDLLDFIADVLLLRVTGARESEFVMRFQQLTGPVMAKGVEDTAFYRYHRLVSLNEVGGDPGRFGTAIAEFHAANQDAQRNWPARMVASSTHDTKRSEDVRVRIGLLSELPERWADEARAWRRLNSTKRDAGLPDGNAEYLFYQTLVGTWPISSERLQAYMRKAVREAKVATSWTDTNEEYEAALAAFIERCLDDRQFVERVEALVAELTPHWHVTSLAQTMLKLTSPGSPDIYQGTELWDLSLVDPDNRRPVDYELRRRLLDRAANMTAEQVMTEPAEGLPKLWLIRRVLDLRKRRPELFGEASSYAPLRAVGARAEHVVAFARGGEAVVVVPRLIARLRGEWLDTSLDLPTGTWQDELTDERYEGGAVSLARLLRTFPGALLLPAL
jgi:(1->4)-alpha-D-glucan 1-alpha-D-glucosylmutase